MKWYKPSEKLPEEGRLVILATKDKRTGYSEIDVDIAEASSYAFSDEKYWYVYLTGKSQPISESDRWAYIELPEE